MAPPSLNLQVVFAIRNAHEHEPLRCRKRQGAIAAVVVALLRTGSRQLTHVSRSRPQAGRLFFIGRKGDGGVRAHERMIEQCQGLWTDGQTLWTSGLYMLWRFENMLRNGEVTPTGADRKFVPVEGRVIGGIDTHDIGVGDVDGARRPIFVNTLYCCLATISETASFRPLCGKFPFRSGAGGSVPPERTGDGRRPSAFVSAVKPLGCRRRLARPAARRWHRDRRGQQRDRRQRLFDAAFAATLRRQALATEFRRRRTRRRRSGRWHVHTGVLCPGYARGLAFIGRYAVIGLSRPRHGQTFAGLALDDRLSENDAVARCGDADRRHRQRERRGMGALRARSMNSMTSRYCRACGAAEAIGFKSDDIKREITVEQT